MNRSRIFRLVIAILACILLAQQIVNYYYIKSLDRQYSDIITDKLSVLESLEGTAYASENMERAVIRLANNRGKKYDSLISIADKNRREINSNLLTMKKYAVSESENASIDTLNTLYNSYTQIVDTSLKSIKTVMPDSLRAAVMVSLIREKYNDFMSKQISQSRFFVERGKQVSDSITANTNKTSVLLLMIGILPFITFICIILVALVTLIILGNSMNWFRSSE